MRLLECADPAVSCLLCPDPASVAAAEINAEMVKEVRDATKSKAGAYTEEQLLSDL